MRAGVTLSACVAQVYSSYTSSIIGVVMSWDEVVHSNASMSLDRFISFASAFDLYPTVLTEEELGFLFHVVLSNNESACKKLRLPSGTLCFPHFLELLCRCAAKFTPSASPAGDQLLQRTRY